MITNPKNCCETFNLVLIAKQHSEEKVKTISFDSKTT
jgi:hypothetical protein